MGMTEEMMNDTLDDLLTESGDEEEQDAIVNQVVYNYFYFYFARNARHYVKLAAMERGNLNKKTIIQVLDEIGIEVSGKVTSFLNKDFLEI